MTHSRLRHRSLPQKKQINHNLEEQAQASFNRWCGECEQTIAIEKLCDNVLDYSPFKNDKVIPLNSSDVTEGVFSDIQYCQTHEIKGQFKKHFKKGDILYSEIRPRNHHYAYCYFDPKEYLASTRLMVIRARQNIIRHSILLYQYLLMPEVLEQFTTKTESRSGTFPQGNYKDLTSAIVPFSENNFIISEELNSLYNKIWANLEENKRLSELRDSLLPNLMSGELSINEIDC